MACDLNRANECHEQYTADLEFVAKFLKREARIFGCKKEWLNPPEMDEGHQSHTLSLPHFKFVADFLAKESAFSVPAHIMDALNRGIDLRIECNSIYEKQMPERVAANERHRHAIRVFQGIRQTLLPKLESTSSGSSAEIQSLTDMDETRAASGPARLIIVAPKLSFAMEGLRRLRQTIQRCWSRRKADVKDGDLL